MGFKIKVESDPYRLKGPHLCCTLSPEARCTFCNEVMCNGCAIPWSPRKHFIVDLCRKRFTEVDIAKGTKCYVDRLKESKKSGALEAGDCKICKKRRASASDRLWIVEDDEDD